MFNAVADFVRGPPLLRPAPIQLRANAIPYPSPPSTGFLEANERARARGSCATCDVFTGVYKSLWWMSTMASATTPPLSDLKRTPLGITKSNNEFSVNPNLYSLNTKNSARTKWESTTAARHTRAKLMDITLDVAQRRFCQDTSVFGKRNISSSRGQGCDDCSISSSLCSVRVPFCAAGGWSTLLEQGLQVLTSPLTHTRTHTHTRT